jgi:hypothetical protein
MSELSTSAPSVTVHPSCTTELRTIAPDPIVVGSSGVESTVEDERRVTADSTAPSPTHAFSTFLQFRTPAPTPTFPTLTRHSLQ